MRFAYLIALAVCAGCYDPGDLGDTPYRCSPTYPECPDGYTCQLTSAPNPSNQNKCVRNAGSTMGNPLTIPKTSIYGGNQTPDPALKNGCPANDAGNDLNNPSPDADGGGQVMDAICPSGDVDVFTVTATGQYVKVLVKYNIMYGDLDVGLFDANGNLKQYDNDSTQSVACVATSAKLNGTYYAVVVGAPKSLGCTSNCTTDQASYTLQVTKDATNMLSCGGGGGDMAMPPDLSF
jgi:hypothetical protein